MSAETVVGYINLIEHKIPVRNVGRELRASQNLAWLFNSIANAEDRAIQKRAVRTVLLRWALWNEGEKILSLIEEASAHAKVSGDIAQTHAMPITRDILNRIVSSADRKSAPGEAILATATSALPNNAPYAFDLVHYDAEKKALRMISMVYCISMHKDALDRWRNEVATLPSALARLARQYYDIDIEHCEFALIDPLLDDSDEETGVWSIFDLDQLLGKAGIANRGVALQEDLWGDLLIRIGDTFADTQSEQAQLMEQELMEIALEALDSVTVPQVQILKPDDMSR
ncbi:hypothetical protein CQ054_19920 [Ochrobactrum sp. MYb29]|uniref:hypothetical protein n=1 Tax=Brucella pituitosa TaxID=571256 RepID=UPI000C2723BE|nr:hypothetical protein [Brucella pituitosa]PJO49367.1 hypothetical protein CWE02_06245 [Brucella pituitosa]PRA82575.1 hypothetical protein CQ054_19920 [Ochrobactrum sp. MYb29]TCQ73049.1 hypothetical protein EDF68_11913 [Ochrobactrum sp. BH3]